MNKFVGSLFLAGGVFIMIVLAGSLFHLPLTTEDFAFHMAIGVYLGLRFGSDFKDSLVWKHLGISLCVYLPLWAIFAHASPGPLPPLSLPERGLVLGALAGVTMLLTLIVYEAFQQSAKARIQEHYVPEPSDNPIVIVPPHEVASHWIDQHEQALLEKSKSTAAMIFAAEWACRAWDNEVVRLYKLLLPAVNHDLKVVLVDSQKAWLKLRQSDMLFGELVYDMQQGSMYAPMQVSARAQISKDRALRLKARLELLDVAIPPFAPHKVPANPLTEQDFLPDNEVPGHVEG